MDLITVLVLSILQGILEWLPVSSEGQIVLVTIKLFDLSPDEAISIAIFLHLGTMFVVLVRFREDFIKMARGDINLIRLLFFATLGTGISALPCYFFLRESWEQMEETFLIPPGDLVTILVGIFLIVTGILLHRQKEVGVRVFERLSDKEAFFLGIAQGFAVLPGISRSGMTITVLLYISLTQSESLRGSFQS